MMSATFGEIKTLFARYVGANNDAGERINLVQARLLPEGHWKGTKVPVNFVVYPDTNGNATITLPRELESVLAGASQVSAPVSSYPLPIQNGWYEFAPGGFGAGSNWISGFLASEGRYTTFADWTTAKRLRIKLEQAEVSGTIIFRGTLVGDKIYSADGPDWIEGVGLDYANATVTTTQTFDVPPYQIIKPETYGRIKLYTVDNDGTETLVGWYEPGETSPSYKRYKVPGNCSTDGMTYATICKKAYKDLTDDNDQMLIGNLGAIRHGLEALLKEDASDYERAGQLWGLAKQLLISESENDSGGAQSHVQVEDSFCMTAMSEGLGGHGYWPWAGYGG